MVIEDMELKDIILSTIDELNIDTQTQKQPVAQNAPQRQRQERATEDISEEKSIGDERLYLESMRERLLVLFEGFQSPNNKNIEAKIDLTLNFLEYLLVTVDERLEKIKREQ